MCEVLLLASAPKAPPLEEVSEVLPPRALGLGRTLSENFFFKLDLLASSSSNSSSTRSFSDSSWIIELLSGAPQL